MERKKFWNKLTACFLALCLALSSGFLATPVAFHAQAASTKVYFLNGGNWAQVGAYIYGDKGELLGGWGTTTATPSEELGGNWMEVSVTDVPPYNIIFFNKDNDSERAELYLSSAEHIYVTNTNQAFTSKEAAEEAVMGTPTTIYFLNDAGEGTVLSDVYVYAYADDLPVAGGWPGIQAEPVEDMGENWWMVTIPRNASSDPFTVIINDNAGNQLSDIGISNYTDNYLTANGELFANQTAAEASVGISYDTVMYFLNNKDWPQVNAYVYGAPGEVLGKWPGTATTPAPELGDKWLKVTVPAKTPFNIIFFNTESDQERTEILIPDDNHLYVTGSQAAYGSQTEAELAEGMGDPDKMTVLHFYNYRQWGDINAYFFTKESDDENAAGVTFGAGWPGKAAEVDAETGDNWWKIAVPMDATTNTFYAIFNDGVNQTEDVKIADKVHVYITPGGAAYATAAEAEEAAANEKVDDGCEEGPNRDIEDYPVEYITFGANSPYQTYEAEDNNTNGEKLEKNTTYREAIQSEASGRSAVKLDETGEYVEFTLRESANSLVLRYCIPDSADGKGMDATLSLYVDGQEKQDLQLTSAYAWVYGGYPYNNTPANGGAHRFFDESRWLFDETLPAGTVIRLQKDAADLADYYVIDLAECELVSAPGEAPQDSLSVTDFGAVADDGQNDQEAFEACLAAAAEQGKEVWIPAGTFLLEEKKALVAEGVTVRGAGMWHTNLVGAGVAFKYQGTSKFYDFAMTGVTTVRNDSQDLAGFEGNGKRATNVTIQNIWMEHIKVGVWSANTERMAIQGCRIRNTYADGINLCSGTKDSVVRNNSLRNTGDDCIAIWPWLADCSGNSIEQNTIQVPTLANGVAIYGGADNKALGNYVADTINNGAGIVIGSEFDFKDGFHGRITVLNNMLNRCGSMQTDENYPIGAIWLWSSYRPMEGEFYVENNLIKDSVRQGILIECNSVLKEVYLYGNEIQGATDGVSVFEGNAGYGLGSGHGVVGGMITDGLTGVEINREGNPNFILVQSVADIFNDVILSDWWLDAVQFVYDNGLMVGKGELFGTTQNITRSEIVQILYANSGKPEPEGTGTSFTDVVEGAWYENAVLWAKENGIAAGGGNGTFGVSNNITRQDLAVMLYKYAKMNDYDTTLEEGVITNYADADKVSTYATEALDWAVTRGIISGKGQGGDISTYRLDPKGNATRAECAAMMRKLLADVSVH